MSIDLEWPDFNRERIGQLIMCTNCSSKKGATIEVPFDEFKDKLKSTGRHQKFKVSRTKCLGVCKPNNVSTILTDDEQIWLGMFKSKREYEILLRWINDCVDADEMLPLPKELEKHRFDRFRKKNAEEPKQIPEQIPGRYRDF